MFQLSLFLYSHLSSFFVPHLPIYFSVCSTPPLSNSFPSVALEENRWDASGEVDAAGYAFPLDLSLFVDEYKMAVDANDANPSHSAHFAALGSIAEDVVETMPEEKPSELNDSADPYSQAQLCEVEHPESPSSATTTGGAMVFTTNRTFHDPSSESARKPNIRASQYDVNSDSERVEYATVLCGSVKLCGVDIFLPGHNCHCVRGPASENGQRDRGLAKVMMYVALASLRRIFLSLLFVISFLRYQMYAEACAVPPPAELDALECGNGARLRFHNSTNIAQGLRVQLGFHVIGQPENRHVEEVVLVRKLGEKRFKGKHAVQVTYSDDAWVMLNHTHMVPFMTP